MIKTSQDRQPGLGTTGIVGALTLTKTGTTARTATFPDAAITVAGLEVANVFTVAQTFSAVLNKMGGGTYSADDSVLLLRRESTAVPNSHAVRDESVWTVASGGGGYCAFDSAPSYAGASAFNHLHSFQSRQTYNGTVSLTDLIGYWSQEAHTGTGTVTNRRGVWVKDPTGSGTITNNIGIHVDTLTRGGVNTAIYTAGPTKCQFDGNIILGQSHTTAGTPVIAMTSTVAGDHGMNVRNLSTGTSSYAYFSLRNDATASALFTSYGSGYTGTGYGLTLGNFTALQAFGASNLGFILGTSSTIPLIIGTNNAEVARFPSGGGLVIGSTALLASERLRVSGGTMGTPGATDVLLAGGKLYAGDTSATSIQTAGGITTKGITSTVAGIAAIFDSGAAADARMEFRRNGVRQGLFAWDTAALRFEGDNTAGAYVYFKTGGADRISISNTGIVTIHSATDGSLTCNGRITAKVAVPGSFADLAAVRTYLASILT